MVNSYASAAPRPASQPGEKIFYLVLLNGTNISDLAEAQPKNISNLISEGSSALLSSRAQSRYNQASAYFSINTSNYAKCKRGCNLGFNQLEILPGNVPAMFRFATSTGIMPEPFNVLNLFRTVKPMRRNLNYIYPGKPGILGDALKEAGVDVYTFGNADIVGIKGYNYRREISVVGMDTSGLTKYGDVSSGIITSRKDFPLGLSLDERALMQKVNSIKKGPALVIIELSDFQRLESIMSSNDLSQQFSALGSDWVKAFYLTTVARSDGMVGDIMEIARENGGAVMLALVRAAPAMRSDGVIAMYGSGIPPGRLTSMTTHRPGFVSVIDITPTIISYFGSEIPDKVYGKKIDPYKYPGGANIQQIALQSKVLGLMDFRVRPMFINGYCLAIIFLLLFMLFLGKSKRMESMRWVRVFFYFLALQPLSSCVPSFFIHEKFILIFAASAVAALIVSMFLSLLFRSWEVPVVIMAFAYSAALLCDVFAGSRMPLNTIFGYSTHYAGRFYGLGNIQTAQLVGAVSVVVAALTASKKMPVWLKSSIASAAGILCCVALAAGTDFGGIISALATFGLMALYFIVRKLSVKTFLLIGALTVLFILVVIVASRFIPSVSQTHYGVFFGKLSEGNFSYVLMILKGKAKLVATSFFGIYWDLLLAAILSIMAGIYLRFRVEAVALFKDRPELYVVGKALLYGGVASFLLNDSGVSVAVNMWTYWIFVFLLVMAQRRIKRGGSGNQEPLAEESLSPEAAV